MRMTASASSGRPARSALTSSRWQNERLRALRLVAQNAARKLVGCRRAAAVAAVSAALPAASMTSRWNSSLSAICSSTAASRRAGRARWSWPRAGSAPRRRPASAARAAAWGSTSARTS